MSRAHLFELGTFYMYVSMPSTQHVHMYMHTQLHPHILTQIGHRLLGIGLLEML